MAPSEPRPSSADVVGSQYNTDFPSSLIPQFYGRVFGPPPAYSFVVDRKWKEEITGLTLAVGRPLTRPEYNAWSETIMPRLYFHAGASLALAVYLIRIPFSKQIGFFRFHKGPSDPYVFPSIRRPWIQGRPARMIWMAARGAFVFSTWSLALGITESLMTLEAAARALKEPRLAYFHQDRKRYTATILNELKAQNPDLLHAVHVAKDSTSRATRDDDVEQQGEPKKVQLSVNLVQTLIATRQKYDDVLKQRGRDGTWHRLDSEHHGASDEQSPERSEDATQSRASEVSLSDDLEAQGGEHDDASGRAGEEQQKGVTESWQQSDQRHLGRQQRQQQQQERPLPPLPESETWGSSTPSPSSSPSKNDGNVGGWDSPVSIDDVPSNNYDNNSGPGSAAGSAWDRVRQQNIERAQRRAQQQSGQQQWGSSATEPSSSSASSATQSGRGWDSVRSKARRGQEPDAEVSEEQMERETINEQSQREFNTVVERERKAANRDDTERKW